MGAATIRDWLASWSVAPFRFIDADLPVNTTCTLAPWSHHVFINSNALSDEAMFVYLVEEFGIDDADRGATNAKFRVRKAVRDWAISQVPLMEAYAKQLESKSRIR